MIKDTGIDFELESIYSREKLNQEKPILDFIKNIFNEKRLFMSVQEVYCIYNSIKAVKKINGSIAELGVYHGGSAKLICEVNKIVNQEQKKVFLFDTFNGIPIVKNEDQGIIKENKMVSNLSDVKNYLQDYKDTTTIIDGFFPETTSKIPKNELFSFVHIDSDSYQSIKDGLEFFYTAMKKGGIIMVHDYLFFPGAKKAVDDFLENKEESLIELYFPYSEKTEEINSYALITKL